MSNFKIQINQRSTASSQICIWETEHYNKGTISINSHKLFPIFWIKSLLKAYRKTANEL